MSMKDATSVSLTLSAFQAALRTKFRLQLDKESSLELVLAEVRTARQADEGRQGRSFSILFHGPRDPLMPQRMYRFGHETLGAFDLFIVPVARDDAHCHYEAVFNLDPAGR